MLGIVEASLEDYRRHVVVSDVENVAVNDAVLALIREEPKSSAARFGERL